MVISEIEFDIWVYTRGLVEDRGRSLRRGKPSATTAPRARDSNAAWAARLNPCADAIVPKSSLLVPLLPFLVRRIILIKPIGYIVDS